MLVCFPNFGFDVLIVVQLVVEADPEVDELVACLDGFVVDFEFDDRLLGATDSVEDHDLRFTFAEVLIKGLQKCYV